MPQQMTLLSTLNASTDLESRTLRAHEIRVEGDEKSPVIRASIKFDTLSVPIFGFREKIASTAFDSALDDPTREVLAFWNHNSDLPLGRRSAATVGISKTKTLFKAEVHPNMDTSWGRDAVASIKRGDVNGLSFGFRILPDGDKWEEDENQNLIRTLINVELSEVSPTPNPAYPQSAAKVRSEEQLQEIRAAVRHTGSPLAYEAVEQVIRDINAADELFVAQTVDRQRRDRLHREFSARRI